MRYRNDTDRPLTVATDPPVLVESGEDIDLPDHVAGLTRVDEPEATPAEVEATELPPVLRGRRRASDTASDTASAADTAEEA